MERRTSGNIWWSFSPYSDEGGFGETLCRGMCIITVKLFRHPGQFLQISLTRKVYIIFFAGRLEFEKIDTMMFQAHDCLFQRRRHCSKENFFIPNNNYFLLFLSDLICIWGKHWIGLNVKKSKFTQVLDFSRVSLAITKIMFYKYSFLLWFLLKWVHQVVHSQI